jgi:hypothetical protein
MLKAGIGSQGGTGPCSEESSVSSEPLSSGCQRYVGHSGLPTVHAERVPVDQVLAKACQARKAYAPWIYFGPAGLYAVSLFFAFEQNTLYSPWMVNDSASTLRLLCQHKINAAAIQKILNLNATLMFFNRNTNQILDGHS